MHGLDDFAVCGEFAKIVKQNPLCVCPGLSTVTHSNTCGGDSGGPYFILKGTTPVLVGVTSYGNSVCGSKTNNLDVPTSVMHHAKWINNATKNSVLMLKGGI